MFFLIIIAVVNIKDRQSALVTSCDVTEEELECFKARGELKALEVSKLIFLVSFITFSAVITDIAPW